MEWQIETHSSILAQSLNHIVTLSRTHTFTNTGIDLTYRSPFPLTPCYCSTFVATNAGDGDVTAFRMPRQRCKNWRKHVSHLTPCAVHIAPYLQYPTAFLPTLPLPLVFVVYDRECCRKRSVLFGRRFSWPVLCCP